MSSTFCQLDHEGQQEASNLKGPPHRLESQSSSWHLAELACGCGQRQKTSPEKGDTGTRTHMGTFLSLAPLGWLCYAGWSWALERLFRKLSERCFLNQIHMGHRPEPGCTSIFSVAGLCWRGTKEILRKGLQSWNFTHLGLRVVLSLSAPVILLVYF